MYLDRKIQSYLRKHRATRRYLSVTVVLSLLIALAVVASLIMPAVSMASDEMYVASEDMPVMLYGDADTVQENDLSSFSVGTAYNLANATSLTASFEQRDSTLQESETNVAFSISYTTAANAVSTEQPYVYYQLDRDHINILNAQSGSVFDTTWSTTAPSGYYEIGTDGLIKIRFTQKYLTENATKIGTGGISGTLNFDGQVKRDASNNGDQAVTIGSTTLEIPFLARSVALSKNGTLDVASHTITWTIIVQNGTNGSISGYTLTDAMFPEEKTSITIKDQNGTVIAPDRVESELGAWNGNTFTFNQELANSVTTFSFQTALTEDQIQSGDLSNTANLTNGGSYDEEKTANVSFSTPLIEVNKVGKQDYTLSDVTDNGMIIWTTTITNPYGFSLNGTVLTDSMFPDTISSIVVTDGTVTRNDDGSLTLNTDASAVTITYKTAVSGDDLGQWNRISNTMSARKDGKDYSGTGSVDSYNPFDITKDGTVNNEDATVTWTIDISQKSYADGMSLNGYKIQDAAFASLKSSNIECSTNGITITKDDDSDTLTLNTNGNNITSTRLTYTVSLITDSNGKMTNTAKMIFPGGSDYKSSSKEVTYTARSTISKYASPSSETVQRGSTDRAVSWTIDLVEDAGFAGKTLTDTPNSPLTIDCDSLVIQAKKKSSDAWTTLAKDTDYTIEETSTGWEVKFSDTLNADYHYVTVTYGSTVDVSDVGSDQTGSYTNAAQLGDGNAAEGTYSFTKSSTQITKTLVTPSATQSGSVDSDSTTKDLQWKVSIAPSGSLKSNSVLVDTLSGTGHSISEAQANACVVTGYTDEGKEETLTAGANADYTIECISTTTFEITFLKEADYAKIEITYHTTADLEAAYDDETVTGDSRTFSNESTFDKKSASSSYTFTKTDTTVSKECKTADGSGSIGENASTQTTVDWEVVLHPDYSEKFDNETYTDTLSQTGGASHVITPAQRSSFALKATKLADNTSETITNDSTLYTLTFYDADGNAIPAVDETTDAVKFEVKFQEGVSATYRTVTIAYQTTADYTGMASGSTATFQNEAAFLNKTDTATYNFTSELPPYSKTAMDKDGNPIENGATRLLDSIKKSEDEEYYIFTWRIDLKSAMAITDTLPEGFELCNSGKSVGWSDGYSLDYFETPLYIWAGSGIKNITPSVTTTENGKTTVTFPSDNGAYFIGYSARIPVATLKEQLENNGGTLSISNTIVSGDNATYTSTQTITNITPSEPDLPKEDNLLTKDASKINADHTITYGVDFNPEGKTLSNGSYVTLKDVLAASSANASLELRSVAVYRVDGTTPVDINNLPSPIGTPITDYTTVFNTEHPVTEVATTIEKNSDIRYYIKNVMSGDQVTIRFNGNASMSCDVFHIFFKDKNGNDISNVSFSQGQTTNADGNFDVTVTVPDGASIISAETWSYNTLNNVEVLSATRTSDQTQATLDFTVPDATHLYIQYTYWCSDTGDSKSLSVSNQISLDSSTVQASATKDSVSVSLESSGASSSVNGAPTIYKCDIGNVTTNNLRATFTLEMYTSSGWQYATTIADGDSGHTVQSWNSDPRAAATLTTTENGYSLCIEENTLYRLKETVSPSGYESPSDDTYYYFIKGTYSETLHPEDVKASDIVAVQNTINVYNNRLIAISVSKTWVGLSETSASIEATLYWSTEKVTDGFPSKLNPLSELGLGADYPYGETTTVSTTDEQPADAQWQNLPNGKDGVPIYYYVKETAYTVNGTTYRLSEDDTYKSTDGKVGPYKPLYANNAVNSTGSVSITNSQSLSIEKLWRNSDNTDMDSAAIPVEQLQCRLYGDPDSTESGGTLIDTYTLAADEDGNWKVAVPQEKLTGYTTFRVEEVVENTEALYGYSTSIVYQLDGTVGKIQIINKNTTTTTTATTGTLQVTKTWENDTEDDRPESITVHVYRSTQSPEDLASAATAAAVAEDDAADTPILQAAAYVDTAMLMVQKEALTEFPMDTWVRLVDDSTLSDEQRKYNLGLTSEQCTGISSIYVDIEGTFNNGNSSVGIGCSAGDWSGSWSNQVDANNRVTISGINTSKSFTHIVTFPNGASYTVTRVTFNYTDGTSLVVFGDPDPATTTPATTTSTTETTTSTSETTTSTTETTTSTSETTTSTSETTTSTSETTTSTSETTTSTSETTTSTSETTISTTTTATTTITPIRVDPAVPTGGCYQSLTLTAANGWRASLEELPLEDENGNLYYYYILEEDPRGSYIPIRYTVGNTASNVSTLPAGGTVSYGITNYLSNPDHTQLPSTGGGGTKAYTYTGAAICIVSTTAIGYLSRRRHKKSRMT